MSTTLIAAKSIINAYVLFPAERFTPTRTRRTSPANIAAKSKIYSF